MSAYRGFVRWPDGAKSNVEHAAGSSVCCDAIAADWYCTRPNGHAGRHEAGDGYRALYASWRDSRGKARS